MGLEPGLETVEVNGTTILSVAMTLLVDGPTTTFNDVVTSLSRSPTHASPRHIQRDRDWEPTRARGIH